MSTDIKQVVKEKYAEAALRHQRNRLAQRQRNKLDGTSAGTAAIPA
jgi:hypothetical protein